MFLEFKLYQIQPVSLQLSHHLVQVPSLDEIGAQLLNVELSMILEDRSSRHGCSDCLVAIVYGDLGVFQSPVLTSRKRDMLELLYKACARRDIDPEDALSP